VWLALAVIFSELATCQHHKNEIQARDMEMTAEQFETLQMYNQMKKEKVVEPDSDEQVSCFFSSPMPDRAALVTLLFFGSCVQVSTRCGVLLAQGVCTALLRMSSATSERTRKTVILALARLAREQKHRGVRQF